MRALLLITALLVAVACDSPGQSGQLGLPTSRPTPAPTAAPRTTQPGGAGSSGTSASPGASASPGTSASPGSSASASPSGSPTPAKIVAASATQSLLTVRYSAPMRSATNCGSVGQPSTLDGAIDRVARYASSDRALDEALQSAVSATLNSDCSSVTFVFTIAAPTGTFTVTPTGMIGRDGTRADAAGVSVSIADEGRPRVASVSASGTRIAIAYSEPMREIGEGGGVLMLQSYKLDGADVPAADITCADAGCRTVWITARPGSLTVGRSYQLRIANVVDRAGLNITPDPTTLSFVART